MRGIMDDMDAAEVIRNGMADSSNDEVTEAIAPHLKDGKVLLKMLSGAGWMTPSEVKFSRQHPFQIVDSGEAMSLLMTKRFEIATKSEVLAFYNKK